MRRRQFLAGLALAIASGVVSARRVEKLPGQIILVENIEGNRALVRFDPNTGRRQRLTHQKREEDYPRLCPDGKTLIFACNDLTAESRWQIRKFDLITHRETVLVAEDSWPICWVSASQFLGCNADFEAWIYNLEGKPLRKVANPGGHPVAGTMAGQEFVYGDLDNDPKLWAVNLSTGATRKLTGGADPTYSAPLASILYWNNGCYRLALNGGKPNAVKELSKFYQVTYSPDGRYLAWITQKEKTSLVIAGNDYRVLRSIKVPNTVNTLHWGGGT